MTTPVFCGLLGLHAQTSVHAGAGAALGAVDLPIQRERHTHWPMIAGSALKGVLRDAFRDQVAAEPELDQHPRWSDRRGDEEAAETPQPPQRPQSRREQADATLKVNLLFGPPTAGAAEFAGALSVTDARLLAFPVRSLRGVFAWITCAGTLERLARDARLVGGEAPTWNLDAPLTDGSYIAAADCPCVIPNDPEHTILLEDADFRPAPDDGGRQQAALCAAAEWIGRTLLPGDAAYDPLRRRFARQLVLLSDDDFTHFARHATEFATRIALNYESKTVRDGALFYQEFLPSESVLYSVLLVNSARGGQRPGGPTLTESFTAFKAGLGARRFLQIGGDETTGKGFCAVRLATQEHAA